VAAGLTLRLAMSGETLRAVAGDPLVAATAAGPAEIVRLCTRHFDTPQGELAARGFTLRVHQEDGRFSQILAVAGEEWHGVLASERPDLALLPPEALADALERPEAPAELAVTFEMEFVRERRHLLLPAGTVVELDLDQGAMRTGGDVRGIAEARLELEEGSPAGLFAFARRLHESHPFRLCHATKAERGDALVRAVEPGPRKAGGVALTADLELDEALRRIAAACAAQLGANEACAEEGDPGGIHQMRVASRRLRAALALFRNHHPPEWREDLQADLRWFAGELAAAREWHVFLSETLPPVERALPGDAGLARLRQRAEEALAASCGRAREALAHPRYTRLLLDLGEWLATPPEAAGGRPVGAHAQHALAERHHRVRRRGRRIRKLPPPKLHRLRIAVKRLRYAVEFFEGLYPPKRMRRLLALLRELQDTLGHLQDVATTAPLLDSLADPGLERACGTVLGWQAAARRRTRRKLLTAWREFKRLPPPG